MEGAASELTEMKARLRVLEYENAERKPVLEVVKLLIYFLIAISVVLGVFGLKQFSDIDTIIKEEVSRQFPKDQQAYLQYDDLIGKSQLLSNDFDDIFGKYEAALQNYSNIDKVSSDFDIEGKVLTIIDESTKRNIADQESEDGSSLFEEPWRSGAISTLELLSVLQKDIDIDSDFLFNASQAAGRLKQNGLAFRLMSAANEKRPNDAPVKAAMLSSVIDVGTEQEVNDAFSALMQLVETLTPNSPHIVLSEAWNATEDQRRYPELIDAIERLKNQSAGYVVPSYAHALQAEAYLRNSGKDALQNARSALQLATEKLLNETGYSVWADSTVQQIAKVKRGIEKTEIIHAFLRDQ